MASTNKEINKNLSCLRVRDIEAIDYPHQLEDAIRNNQASALSEILLKVDVNISLNVKHDSALILAVRASNESMVKTLLASPGCNLAYQNINLYSPLDIALVLVHHSQCESNWNILHLLLEAGAEPSCPYAILSVILTALEKDQTEFLVRLIRTFVDFSSSIQLHGVLMAKLQRHQPYYTGNMFDPLLECASDFTIKLIKSKCDNESLKLIVSTLPVYLDFYLVTCQFKRNLLIKFIVYLSVVGWRWTDRFHLNLITNLSSGLAQWCQSLRHTPHSLKHMCRVALLSSPTGRQYMAVSHVPSLICRYLKYADIDSLAPFSPNYNFNSILL
ncbi:uncharacterized protein LOC131952732 [Physella acuta]|uniref:uncharacterized protein LOC131952732 n=1 Tax=Physella acuta TaxID=109671 RepID=UPI0027DB27A0|nr:uncharacterized protein LOC131952732 [Physella acuta]XP_059171525.1 uncharacterized protein LOC131952732 [Physella acuta]XP_059171526.1 uncharacterized protein LOC131952732 [Physella acuta]